MDKHIAAFQHAWTHLRAHNVDILDPLYTEQVQFADPFHRCQGRTAFKAYLRSSYANVEHIQFTFKRRVAEPPLVCLEWMLNLVHPRLNRGRPVMVPGISLLQFDEQGRVHAHRDYFDGADLLYAQLPVVGPVVRWIRNRLSEPN
ncbi:MAG: nuclear transport factor 2 family protein [Pseudomonadota bacterium]|nr:nuclear transport factor 2 family protein [Pseudomonadota bacterium]